MKILMLGNSYTYYNRMPELLAALTGEEVKANVRGSAFLSYQLDENDDLGKSFAKLIRAEKWDYVVLQEQSKTPSLNKEAFLDSARKLCALIRENGATPVFYATWAYRDGTEKLAGTGMTYEEMRQKQHDAYHEAAEENGALVADVGEAFYRVLPIVDVLSEKDNHHPNPAGSLLAASILARVIEEDYAKRK